LSVTAGYNSMREIREIHLEVTFIIIGIFLFIFLIITIPLLLYLLYRKKVFRIMLITSLILSFFIIVLIVGFLSR